MPFIDCKISKRLTDGQKEDIKRGLGAAVGILHKPESYLMVGIADGYDLYFGGEKTEGAYVEVSLFGTVQSADSEKMTARICDILSSCAAVSPDKVYVTYHGVRDWGWNGGNF